LRISYTLPAGALATLTWNGSTTPPPPPVSTINPAAWYQVISTNSGKCLDAADWGTGNGTALQQWSCGVPAADNELWQFRPTSDGYYRVLSRLSPGKSWDIAGGQGATRNGSLAQLWGYSGASNQQWKPAKSAANDYTFASRGGAHCLDVAGVSKLDGARLQVWTCTGGAAQTFRLVARP
jgi:glucosylceramidase